MGKFVCELSFESPRHPHPLRPHCPNTIIKRLMATRELGQLTLSYTGSHISGLPVLRRSKQLCTCIVYT